MMSFSETFGPTVADKEPNGPVCSPLEDELDGEVLDALLVVARSAA
jgi:hypothetical protein